jgi:preprotein translocase subunit SecG
MSTLITVLHVIVCLFLMLTVLLQSGKGGGMGAAFGGGNAATVFGGSGASSFLKRLTAVAGTVFMITSMVLAFIASLNSAVALEKFGEEQQKLAADKE